MSEVRSAEVDGYVEELVRAYGPEHLAAKMELMNEVAELEQIASLVAQLSARLNKLRREQAYVQDRSVDLPLMAECIKDNVADCLRREAASLFIAMVEQRRTES